MVHPKVPDVICLFLIMLTTANQGHIMCNIQYQPRYDPRLTNFVRFSTFPGSSNLENEDFSTYINMQPFMLPGAVETLVDHNKVPKVQKFFMRL